MVKSGKIFGSSAYFSLLAYVVFFARRRRTYNYDHEVNFIPFKNMISNFLALPYLDKGEAGNFYLNLFGNIMMFIPMGFILIAAFNIRKLEYVILWTLGLSVFIELIQYVFEIGLADIDDMILNMTGAALGYFLFKIILRTRILFLR